MIYTSDLDIVINKFINDNLSPSALDNLTAQVATYIRDNNIDRVFVKGLNLSNSKIGGYSAKYKKRRSKAGRQTGFVDLTFTGKFRSDYGVTKTSNGYKVGFRSGYGTKTTTQRNDYKETPTRQSESIKISKHNYKTHKST